jgi:starvation-inducible DNA-binding protein
MGETEPSVVQDESFTSTHLQVANGDPQTGLGATSRVRVIEALQRLLADEMVVYLKTRNFHWNVEGPHFVELHRLFDEQATELAQVIDEVAERIRVLGGYAAGSMNEFLKRTHLGEVSGEHRPDIEGRMELLLLRDHESMARSLRTLVDSFDEWEDAGTQDFVTGVLEGHEKTAWKLRALGKKQL